MLVPKWAKKRIGCRGIQMQAAVVIEAHQDREMSKYPARLMQLHWSHYITFTPPTSTGQRGEPVRDSKALWTGIKWFFLCSVYGPMVIH